MRIEFMTAEYYLPWYKEAVTKLVASGSATIGVKYFFC